MKKYDLFWMTNKEWFSIKENGTFVLNDNAPQEAKISYQHYLAQRNQPLPSD